jgi:hypothetical protein
MSTKNKAKKNELALGDQFNAIDAMDLLRQELKQLKSVTECPFKTSSGFSVGGVTLQTETNILNLLKVGSEATRRNNDYLEYCTAMGLTEFPQFSINGNTLEQINHDIKLKMDVINYSERKAELEELLKEAEGFMSAQDKQQLFFAKLQSKLGNK